MSNSVTKIIKRSRRYIPFENKKPRERKCCPNCDSLNVKKIKSICSYRCDRCGWTGQGIKKVEY